MSSCIFVMEYITQSVAEPSLPYFFSLTRFSSTLSDFDTISLPSTTKRPLFIYTNISTEHSNIIRSNSVNERNLHLSVHHFSDVFVIPFLRSSRISDTGTNSVELAWFHQRKSFRFSYQIHCFESMRQSSSASIV